MKLVVGLGNPSEKYRHTRHNAGFMAIDNFAQTLCNRPNPSALNLHEARFIGDKRAQSLVLKTPEFILIKPQTFMNCSGVAVRAVRDFYKISEILVLHDDLDLGLGAVRIKRGGSSGGHNGLKSLDSAIGNDYVRVRIGIGRPNTSQKSAESRKDSMDSTINTPKNAKDSARDSAPKAPILREIPQNVVDYVLNDFSSAEMEILDEVFGVTNLAIEAFLRGEGVESLQNKFTRKSNV